MLITQWPHFFWFEYNTQNFIQLPKLPSLPVAPGQKDYTMLKIVYFSSFLCDDTKYNQEHQSTCWNFMSQINIYRKYFNVCAFFLAYNSPIEGETKRQWQKLKYLFGSNSSTYFPVAPIQQTWKMSIFLPEQVFPIFVFTPKRVNYGQN